MEITKIVGGVCGSLLVLLLLKMGAEALIHGGEGGHGEEHHNAYVIEVPEGDSEAEVAEEETVDMAALVAEADPASGEGLFRACAACHKLEDGANGVGPYLYGVVGRDIASAAGYTYSDSLGGIEGDWTPDQLGHFLADPKGFASGTKMAYRGMRDAEDRAALIAYLDSLDD
ncbi:c-type cytochrome [Algicella marina]|nr:cytochrome c family protein [Algicella marina]